MRKWMIASLLVGSAWVVSSSLGIAQEPVKIQYWNINTENFGGPAVRELIAKFEAQNPGIKVEPRSFTNAYTGLLQGLQTALAANDAPDVSQIGYL